MARLTKLSCALTLTILVLYCFVPRGNIVATDRVLLKRLSTVSYTSREVKYVPSVLEGYIMNNLGSLGYDTQSGVYAEGCRIWREDGEVPSTLKAYTSMLKNYGDWVDRRGITDDIRSKLATAVSTQSACRSLEPPGGLEAIFQKNSLSISSSGALEPLLPPMRHPRFCFDGALLMDLSYLVHDFKTMCLNLTARSKTVFVDLGASLTFHGAEDQPAFRLIELYRKFGFHFDHIYAYEKTQGDVHELYSSIPEHLQPSYHWINTGVETEYSSKLNPLRMLAEHFTAEDFIVLKLDVDTPSVEVRLVQQLLETEELSGLIDQFYFEHHVLLEELRGAWGEGVQGSVADSLKLFHSLRTRGIPAHFWV